MLEPLQSSYSCSEPYYSQLSDAINGNGALWDWALCPYTATGLGLTGVGLIILATGFVGLRNWSESWTLPLTWLALVAPVLAVALLPGAIVTRIAGIVTLAVAGLLVGLYFWWARG